MKGTKANDPFRDLNPASCAEFLKLRHWEGLGATGVELQLHLGALVLVVVSGSEGMSALEKLEGVHGELPRVPTCIDPGCDHRRTLRVFRAPKGARLSGDAINLFGVAPGVSVLATGMHCLPPTSRKGVAMAWSARAHPAILDPKELPSWLADMARDPTAGRRAWDEATVQKITTPCTDIGNAERLVRRHGHDLRWCGARGSWLIWTGVQWVRDESGEVVRRAKDTVRAIIDEAQRESHEEVRKKLIQHAVASENARRIASMIELARSEVGIAISPDALDTHPWLLNTLNGTLDLRTGALGPHRREDMLTKVCPVPYLPLEQSAEFDRFLARVQPDTEIRDYLQRFAGYCATGVIREHVFPVWWGAGRNGKGTLTDAIRAALGPYAAELPTELMSARMHDGHPTERTTLFGVRFATASETEKEVRLATALVKRLTGGDVIKARYLYQDFFEFEPTHKLMLATNNKPVISETSSAIWDRIHLVPWNVHISDAERDGALRDRLKTDAREAVLAWIVAGCMAWQQEGLNPPLAVRLATLEYAAESDMLGDFLAARTTHEPDPIAPKALVKVLAGALYRAYEGWCEGASERPMSQTSFGRSMATRPGIRKVPKNSAGYPEYVGIRLQSEGEMMDVSQDQEPPLDGFPESTDGFGPTNGHLSPLVALVETCSLNPPEPSEPSVEAEPDGWYEPA